MGQAFINCKGNLIVKGGIVTSERGLVEVNGDLKAEFIENSRLLVKGDVIVTQSIINSNVIVGGKIEIQSPRSGIIGGGLISVRERIITGNLGFDEGRETICRIGVDWVYEKKIAIHENRLNRLSFIEQRETKNLNELKKQISRRADAKKAKTRDEMQKRIDRIGVVRRKIQARIKGFQSKLTWNRDAIAVVNNMLSSNVQLNVGGKGIPITEEIRSVIVTYHKLRNGRINPIDYLDDFENRIAESKAS